MIVQSPTIISFLQQIFAQQNVDQAVIAVSGGIDSAVALTLATRALTAEHVHALLLPFGQQDMADAHTICAYNHLPQQNIHLINIAASVEAITSSLNIDAGDQLRRGNIMARVRMIFVYDLAKQKRALVVGTENKSEYYLGYFTRFGDEASDVEPLSHLTKTQVRALAMELGIPENIQAKAPSAGLWSGQTDEQELGFTYQDVDTIIESSISGSDASGSVQIATAELVKNRIRSQAFKHHVPYRLVDNPTLSFDD